MLGRVNIGAAVMLALSEVIIAGGKDGDKAALKKVAGIAAGIMGGILGAKVGAAVGGLGGGGYLAASKVEQYVENNLLGTDDDRPDLNKIDRTDPIAMNDASHYCRSIRAVSCYCTGHWNSGDDF